MLSDTDELAFEFEFGRRIDFVSDFGDGVCDGAIDRRGSAQRRAFDDRQFEFGWASRSVCARMFGRVVAVLCGGEQHFGKGRGV